MKIHLKHVTATCGFEKFKPKTSVTFPVYDNLETTISEWFVNSSITVEAGHLHIKRIGKIGLSKTSTSEAPTIECGPNV